MLWIGLLCLALSSDPAAAPPEATLLGQWESAVRTGTGVGNILEFYADGRVTQTSVSMGEADYRLEGEWLRLFRKDPSTGKIREFDTQIEFEGSDRFLEKAAEVKSENLSERIGEPIRGGSPLVGRWCSIFLGTLPYFREFTRDRMYSRMPVGTLRGRYQPAGDTMTVQLEGQPVGQYPYRFDKGLLVIKSRDGSEKAYKRPETTLLLGY